MGVVLEQLGLVHRVPFQNLGVSAASQATVSAMQAPSTQRGDLYLDKDTLPDDILLCGRGGSNRTSSIRSHSRSILAALCDELFNIISA